MATVKEFRNNVRPNWCPGCGDFAVQASIQRALGNLDLEPENVAVISGIGCSGRISGYINAYGFHGVHGRSLPVAQGVKLANRDLTVIAAGGDGDGFGIGLGHFMHAARRNIDITYIVMDNSIYGLTKGQHSPTSAFGFKAKTTPAGNIENAISPLQIALAAGISYLAQGFSHDVNQLTELIQKGIEHKGFSLINVFSPCVTYNKVNTYEWYKEHVVNLEQFPDYDPTNRNMAMAKVAETDGLCTGLIYEDKQKQPFETLIEGFKETPIVKQDLHLERDFFEKTMEEFA
ncbi:2-oxoacid:ferredoxin oxidoreductase subunit beta [Sulfoacidibacillus thermotolerans]|uniref:2-oxoacid ferredoxin oxidoreductase n=1 Tax=Sulfoacidibacillus thermotolerans TaxID=1765684 RepID=A0A2U3DCD4_SULT2|nr:2-oxoacid:ferredoxin oxidoreductase subunit beta [Sulfoacidibacillus thermotolerans]PWI58922.1 2-oxoacid ferredoxin oxidoreductase [Sulfoacidibacillus thermotolerans]